MKTKYFSLIKIYIYENKGFNGNDGVDNDDYHFKLEQIDRIGKKKQQQQNHFKTSWFIKHGWKFGDWSKKKKSYHKWFVFENFTDNFSFHFNFSNSYFFFTFWLIDNDKICCHRNYYYLPKKYHWIIIEWLFIKKN